MAATFQSTPRCAQRVLRPKTRSNDLLIHRLHTGRLLLQCCCLTLSRMSGSTLPQRLTEKLPKGSQFTIHHLSSAPTQCPAIFSAPPNEKPELTFRESHFLTASITSKGRLIQVFGLEVLIYTTKYLTTLFVSKADSTGYLHLLNFPKGTPSPLRSIASTFLDFLVRERSRPDRRLVLSLFARAQNQYLFPGSIKWWCKVLGTLMGEWGEASGIPLGEKDDLTQDNGLALQSKMYLRVPGCDLYETKGFFPNNVRKSSCLQHKEHWHASDPLRLVGRSPILPERCLIPRFPDDPKARYLDELDAELADPPSQVEYSPAKRVSMGRWRSVRSLEQFWEMMSFRQECSSGRLVGFLWGVFTPITFAGEQASGDDAVQSPLRADQRDASLPTPPQSQFLDPAALEPETLNSSIPTPEMPLPPPQLTSSEQSSCSPKDINGSGPSHDDQIKPEGRTSSTPPAQPLLAEMYPETSESFYWPRSSRGEVLLPDSDYRKVIEYLTRCDYANEEEAVTSTTDWLDQVALHGKVNIWGYPVMGQGETGFAKQAPSLSAPAVLNAGLIKKKRKPEVDEHSQELDGNQDAVNFIAPTMIRKKPKLAG